MYYYNKVMIAGKLAADPKLTEGKKPEKTDDRVWFKLAVNRYGDSKEPNYISVVAWGKLARATNEYCSTGKSVFVEGELNTWVTIKPDKTYENHMEVVASRVIFGESEDYSRSKQEAEVNNEKLLELATAIAKEMFNSHKVKLAELVNKQSNKNV